MTAALPVTDAPPRPDIFEWRLSVVEAFDIAPRLRRLVLTGDALDRLNYAPGQALVLRMPLPEGGTGRRDYTIRALDKAAGRLSIDFVMHGATPAANWALAAKPGDEIVAQGPRGRTILAPQADWHLFCADETGLPAFAHILETVPPGAPVFAWIEIDGRADEMPIETKAALSLIWVRREGARPGPSPLLLDALAAFALPAGRGHAYLIGETSNVRAQRQHLIARGLARDQIASEGYWRPGRIGGHDHVDD